MENKLVKHFFFTSADMSIMFTALSVRQNTFRIEPVYTYFLNTLWTDYDKLVFSCMR